MYVCPKRYGRWASVGMSAAACAITSRIRSRLIGIFSRIYAVLVKRESLSRHPFDTRYHLTADYEFFYWASDQRPVYKIVDFPIALFDGRDSDSERNWIEVKRQYRQIQGRYDGFRNCLSWAVFVGVHWTKGMIKRFIPEAVLRKRKERYYTTDC